MMVIMFFYTGTSVIIAQATACSVIMGIVKDCIGRKHHLNQSLMYKFITIRYNIIEIVCG